MSAPAITVLMPVFNCERYLGAAVQSILAQSFTDFELLLIDDASTDSTPALLAGFGDARIRLLRNPLNLGLTRSLNIGLREARGALIARQDGDDVSAPDRLAEQHAFLAAHPEVALVGAQGRLIDAAGGSRGNRDLPLETASIRWANFFENPIIHSAVMMRAAIIRDELGGYDESFGCCQDYELWSRLMARRPVVNLAGRLVDVREHGASISATRQGEAAALVRRVVEAHGKRAFSGRPLDAHETALLLQYRAHLGPADMAGFEPLFSDLKSRFAAQHFEAKPGADFRRTVALQRARIAYNLLTKSRALAAAQFLKALREWPPLTLEQPWARILALGILGDQARRLHERFAGVRT